MMWHKIRMLYKTGMEASICCVCLNELLQVIVTFEEGGGRWGCLLISPLFIHHIWMFFLNCDIFIIHRGFLALRKSSSFLFIQRVPLATEPDISLIILTPMKILQRNLNRSTFVVWEMKRNVPVVCVCSAPNCCDTEQ